MQTMCYWFVDLEKRGNITIIFVANGCGQNCHILWWAFNCQFKSSSVFPRVADIPGNRFQMQSIQCNNRLDVVSVFVFFLGRTMRTMVQLMLMSDVGKCNIIKTCNRIWPFSFEDYWRIKT